MEFLLLGLLGLGLTAFAVNSFTSDDDDEAPEEPVEPEPVDPDSGTPDDDSMAGSGDDVLTGRAGDDELTLIDRATGSGNAGNDTLRGDDDSTIFGNLGHDRLEATGGSTAYGGAGRDYVEATRGSIGYGGYGSDSFNASNGGTVYGGQGDDRMVLNIFGNLYGGTSGYGGAGDDAISASGDAMAYGGLGHDTLFGGLDDPFDTYLAPTLTGGAGRDLFIAEITWDSEAPIIITDFDPARDELAVTPGFFLGGDMPFEAAFQGFDTVAGDGFVDLLVRFQDHDGATTDATQTIRLEGLTEFDPATVRIAAQGSDGFTLMDIAQGTPGADTIDADRPVFVRLGGGADVFTSGDALHYAYGGTGADVFTGPTTASDATENSVLSLGNGNDTLTGTLGGQFIDGGAGDDSLTLASGDASPDLYTMVHGGNGDDTITITGTDASRGEIYGGAGNDTISANVGQSYIILDEDLAEADALTLLFTPNEPGGPVPQTLVTGNDADTVTIDSEGFDGTLHQVNQITVRDVVGGTAYDVRVQYVFIDAAADPAVVLSALAEGATDGVAGLSGVVTMSDYTFTSDGDPLLGGGEPDVDDFDVPTAILDRAIASVTTSYVTA